MSKLTETQGIEANADIWADDTLGRKKEAELIEAFLLRRVQERKRIGQIASYVLNIDAPWGSGKTYFLTRFRNQLTANGYLVAYINAWEDDHADDPLLATLSSINRVLEPAASKSIQTTKRLDAFKKTSGKIVVSLVKNIGKAAVKRYAGDFLEEAHTIFSGETDSSSTSPTKGNIASDSIQGIETAIDERIDEAAKNIMVRFEESKASITSFKNKLADFLKEAGDANSKHGTLFVFVDELDRCRPTYAISMLERMKHLFETDGVIFIVATDTAQLQHSIRAVYGSDFDAPRYLSRFFNRQYKLKPTPKSNFIASLFKRGLDGAILSVPEGSSSAEQYFGLVCDGFKLSVRDIEQCFDLFHDVATSWHYKSAIELALMLPLIVLHQQNEPSFDSVASGRLSDPGAERLGSQLSFTFRVNNSDTGKMEQISGYAYLAALSEYIYKSFAKMGRENGSSIARNWAFDRTRAELQTIHRGVLQDGQEPRYSVLRNYGDFVRSISSFSD